MGVTVSVYMCVCMYISMCVLCECGCVTVWVCVLQCPMCLGGCEWESRWVCVRTWACMKRDAMSECACMLCMCDCKRMCVSVVCLNVGVWVSWMCA